VSAVCVSGRQLRLKKSFFIQSSVSSKRMRVVDEATVAFGRARDAHRIRWRADDAGVSIAVEELASKKVWANAWSSQSVDDLCRRVASASASTSAVPRTFDAFIEWFGVGVRRAGMDGRGGSVREEDERSGAEAFLDAVSRSELRRIRDGDDADDDDDDDDDDDALCLILTIVPRGGRSRAHYPLVLDGVRDVPFRRHRAPTPKPTPKRMPKPRHDERDLKMRELTSENERLREALESATATVASLRRALSAKTKSEASLKTRAFELETENKELKETTIKGLRVKLRSVSAELKLAQRRNAETLASPKKLSAPAPAPARTNDKASPVKRLTSNVSLNRDPDPVWTPQPKSRASISVDDEFDELDVRLKSLRDFLAARQSLG
jgi:hypothetical protein